MDGGPRLNASSRRGRVPAFLAVAAAVLAVAAARPLPVDAHVNRTVGPYLIFVYLVGEPYFATNRAGFEIWVKAGERPIIGLERTLRVSAERSDEVVALGLTTTPEPGHYQAELDPAAQEFDPQPGGAWTLRLAGRIEDLDVNEVLPITFPVYPRVGLPSAGSEASSSASAVRASSTADPGSPLLIAGALILGTLAAAAGLVRIRRKPAGRPAPT